MPLIFSPKISRYANLYFFIQNLSEWHFSNRKKHNEEWRKELSLPPEINSPLFEFKKIHQKHSFGEKYLGRPFFLFENPWSEVENLIGKNSAKKIKNIFEILEPYFHEIYKKDEKALVKWLEIIKKPQFIENSFFINNTLANFYGCPLYDKKCSIYLLLSTKEKNGGTSGTINKNTITLELSRTPFKSENLVLNIIWHELIHLYFRNFVFLPLLKECTNNNKETIHKIDELVASALLPNGLLKINKLTPADEKIDSKIFNARVATEKIIQIQKLIYPYLQQKKTVNMELVKQLCEYVVINK